MKMRFFLSFCALLFAAGILGVSLLAAPAASSVGINGDKRLYFSDQLLPDNVLYSFAMVGDRLKLETASPSERIVIQVQYAHRRLEAAQALMDKDNEELAVTTLTKAEKYIQQAAQEALDNNSADSVKKPLIKAIEYHIKQSKDLADQFKDDEHRNVVSALLQQNQSYIEKL